MKADTSAGRWLTEPITLAPKHPDRTTLLHISDLHFRAETLGNQPPLSLLLADVRKHRKDIDLVVCTGDMIDSAFADTLINNTTDLAISHAKDFLKTVCGEAEVNHETGLFVVPGNHDYRIKGIFGLASIRALFPEYFASYFRSALLPDLNLLIASFDSNGTDPRPNWATGIVEAQEFEKFTRWLDDLANRPQISQVTRVALLHHHPMPIAETETRKVTEAIEFGILKNAANFMREAIKGQIDIVLHGHQHFIGYSRASFPFANSAHELAVIAAGSAGQLFNGIHSYNVITIPRAGPVTVEQKILNQGTYEKSHVFQVPEEYAAWRRLQAIRLARSAGIATCGRLYSSDVEIDSAGDSHRNVIIRGLQAKSELVDRLGWISVSVVGSFEEPTCACLNEPMQRVELHPSPGQTTAGKVTYDMTFDPKLSMESSLDIELHRNAFNSFFFDVRDRIDVTGGNDETESAGVVVGGLYDSLSLTVRFNHQHQILAPRVRVTSEDGDENRTEGEYCGERLTYSEANRTAHLTVDHPLPGHVYLIRWNLPQEADAMFGAGETLAAEEIEKALARCATNQMSNPLRPTLADLQKQIGVSLNMAGDGTDPKLALMYFDRAGGLLKVAAGLYDASDPIFSWGLKKGRGIEGQALRRRTAVFCFSGSTAWKHYYQGPPGSSSADSLVFAIPLTYPINTDRVVAVLRLSSSSPISPLLRLERDTPAQQRVADLVSDYYIKSVMPVVGLRPPFAIVENGVLDYATVEELTR